LLHDHVISEAAMVHWLLAIVIMLAVMAATWAAAEKWRL